MAKESLTGSWAFVTGDAAVVPIGKDSNDHLTTGDQIHVHAFILPSIGGVYTISVIQCKSDFLLGMNPATSSWRARRSLYISLSLVIWSGVSGRLASMLTRHALALPMRIFWRSLFKNFSFLL